MNPSFKWYHPTKYAYRMYQDLEFFERHDTMSKFDTSRLAKVKKDRYTEYTYHTPSIGINKLITTDQEM